MAKRLNKKLLFIVSTCTVVTAGVVGFVAVNAYRADATRFVRAADAEMAAGEFRKAATLYGRAVGKQPNNIEYHGKFIEASRRIVPESATEARERYGQLVASLRRRAQLARNDEALWRAVFDEQRLQAEFFDSVLQWQNIYDSVAADILAALPPDDPIVAIGKAQRCYAQSRRILGLAPEEIGAAIAELEGVLPQLAGVDRDLAYAGLLNIRLHQATSLAGAGQGRQATEAWQAFDALLAQAIAAEPEGFEIRRIELARLRTRREAGEAGVDDAALDRASERLIAMATASGDPVRTYEAWKSVAGLGDTEDMRRAIAMMEAYLERNPDALLHRRVLATGLQFVDMDRAEREARAIVDSARLPVGFVGAAQEELRVSAAQQLFDVEFARFGAIADPAARAEGLQRLERARDRIRELGAGLPDDSILVKTEGKLAFARGDYSTAAVRFNEVFRRGSLVDAELYVLASVNAEQMNELGIALERTVQGLQYLPSNLDLQERRAVLELRLGRFPEALRTAQRVLERDASRRLARDVADAAAASIATGGAIDERDPIVQAVTKAQAAFDRRDYAAAKAELEPILAANPRDLRVIRALAQVLVAAGDRDAAVALAERGLEIAPGEPNLVRIVSFAASDDPVERVKEAVSQLHPEGPDRVVWTYIRLANLLATTEAGIPAAERSDPAEAARLSAMLPSIRRSVDEWRGRALAADASHPALHEYDFGVALEAKEYAKAGEILAAAEKARRDPAVPPIMKARLELAQSRPGAAADVLLRAINSGVETADVHRVLGIAQEQMGDLAAATRSFAEAYKRKPTDPSNIRFYVQALTRAGDRPQALVVLRDARRVAVDDQSIGDAWIALEAEIGDRRLARTTRETRYRLVPGDRQNAIALASMLAEMQPDREDVLDGAGAQRFSETQWRNLDDAARSRELERVRAAWRQQSDAIYATLLRNEPEAVDLAVLRANTLRRQGRGAEGEQMLRALTERLGDRARSEPWIALGVHLAEIGNVAGATAAFAEAANRQDDAVREADASIGEYWFQRGQWDRAVGHFERLAERRKDRQVALRLAEIHSRLRQFDKAEARLAEAIASGGRDFVIDQLEANLAEGKGDAFAAQGRSAEALEAYAAGLAALKRAREANATNPVIFVQEASLLRKQAAASGDRSKLAAALAAADQATRLRGDFWPAAQAKSDLLLATGDVPGAIAELERFVRGTPSSTDGRRRLVEVLGGTGSTRRAAEVAREAIAMTPNDPLWHVALGEIELLSGRVDQAVAAYETADRLRPSAETLHRLTDLRMRRSSPDWAGVVASLRDRSDDVRTSPYLQSAIAAALVNTGQERQGLDALRESYRFARKAIADGTAQPSLLDGWYGNLRLALPARRNADAERFLIETAGSEITARDYRALAEFWLGSGGEGPKRAIEFVAKGLAIDDGKDARVTGRLHDIAGSAHYLLGDCRAAVDAFERAIRALPDEAVLLNNFAYLCAECGDDPKRGLSSAERAVQLAPNRADFLDTLGFVQARTGDRTAAVDTLMRSLRAGPSASANFHLAQIMLDDNRPEDARRYLQAAGDLKPDPVLQGKINELIQRLR